MKKHYQAIDALRGIAILSVIAHHSGADSESIAPSVYRSLFQAGWAGVDLFFAISGFLVCGILLRVAGGEKQEEGWWVEFLQRRVKRILPLYGLVVLIPVICLAVMGYQFAFSPLAFLGVSNFPLAKVGGGVPFAYTWSLSLEEQFYLLAAGMFALRPSKKVLVGILGLLIVVCPFIRAYVWDGQDGTYVLPWCRLDALAWGCLGAVALRERWSLTVAAWLTPVGLGIVAVAIVMGVTDHHTWVVAVPGMSILAATGIGLVTLLASGRWQWTGTSSNVLGHVGRRCFGLYLLHPLVLPLIWRGVGAMGLSGMARPSVTFLLTSAICLILAEVSWRKIEAPWIEGVKATPVTA